ncbi:MAG: DUF2325 domain-containing protein [Nitrospira sp.]|nr:DUF2325 domain-containing protein [Nitrospira sp.]
MTILVVGGDSAKMFRRCAADTRRHVEHWTGRKSRDLVRSIPKATDAIVVVLDRVSHALAKRVRREAVRRGLPVYFQKRGRQVDAGAQAGPDWLDPLRYREDP